MSDNNQHNLIAFVSVSLSNRPAVDDVINRCITVLDEFNIKTTVFVDNYQFSPHDEVQMMKISCQEIAQSDFVLAEVSHKAVGVGVEVGYAIGIGKPVIYMRHKDAPHSTTIAGISTYKIVYHNDDNLAHQLRDVLKQLLTTIV